MKAIITLLTGLLAIAGAQGNTASLFYKNCVGQQSQRFNTGEARIFLVSAQGGFAGMSCQELKSAFEFVQISSMVLLPVSIVLKTPGVREEIAAQMAAMGLTLLNPVTLGVTVIGSVGVVTVYFVMKESLEECQRRDREQFKQELLRELEDSGFPKSTGGRIPFKIKRDGDSI